MRFQLENVYWWVLGQVITSCTHSPWKCYHKNLNKRVCKGEKGFMPQTSKLTQTLRIKVVGL
jgi:hypothetical protein